MCEPGVQGRSGAGSFGTRERATTPSASLVSAATRTLRFEQPLDEPAGGEAACVDADRQLLVGVTVGRDQLLEQAERDDVLHDDFAVVLPQVVRDPLIVESEVACHGPEVVGACLCLRGLRDRVTPIASPRFSNGKTCSVPGNGGHWQPLAGP
jgi:hypothetical protein